MSTPTLTPARPHLHLLSCVAAACADGCPRDGLPTAPSGRCGCDHCAAIDALLDRAFACELRATALDDDMGDLNLSAGDATHAFQTITAAYGAPDEDDAHISLARYASYVTVLEQTLDGIADTYRDEATFVPRRLWPSTDARFPRALFDQAVAA